MEEAQGDKNLKIVAIVLVSFFVLSYLSLLLLGLVNLFGFQWVNEFYSWMYVFGFPFIVFIIVIVFLFVHIANWKMFGLFHLGIYIKFLETFFTLMGGIYLTEIEQPLWLFSLSLFFMSFLKCISWWIHFKVYMGKKKEDIIQENYVNQL